MVARRAHNPKVVGSNPASATTKVLTIPVVKAFFFCLKTPFTLFQYRIFIKLYRNCTELKTDIISFKTSFLQV